VVLSRALVAFDERRATPTANLGTLGSAGDVVWTGTRVLTPASVAYVELPGVVGNNMTVPDAAAVDITGDICHIWHVRPADITPAAAVALGAKFSPTGGNQSWRVTIETAGTIIYAWVDSGGTTRSATSTVALSVNGYADNQALHIAVTHDVDNGAAGNSVRFWTSPDATTWTQLGTTVTQAFTTSIFNSAAVVEIGSRSTNTASPFDGGIFRYRMNNGIGASGAVSTANVVLDVDTSVLTDMAATSFTATTGQTVTINRSTGATYKTKVVLPGIPSRILNGTSDYGEVADLAGLDFGASDSFTVWALVETWATFGTNDAIVAKKANNTDTTQGWKLANGPSTAAQVRAEIGDGTNGVGCTTSASRTSGALTLVSLIRNVTADTIAAAINGTIATPVTDTTTGTLANAEVVRFGRLSGAGTEYTPLRVFAWGIHPYAMTSAELTALRTALINGTDPGSGPRTVDLSVPTRTVDLSVPARTVDLTIPTRTLEISA
jgi:hypothetical protein